MSTKDSKTEQPRTLQSVMVRFFEGWLIPEKCPECGKRKWRKGWNVCPDCMGGLDII